MADPAARLPIIGVFNIVLWYDQLPPVTSLLPVLARVTFSEGRDLTTLGTEAPLPLRVLRDLPDETVEALVVCLVIIILLTATTMAVVGVA